MSLTRHNLDLRIERGTDRQAALQELLLATALEDVAADLLETIDGDTCARRCCGW